MDSYDVWRDVRAPAPEKAPRQKPMDDYGEEQKVFFRPKVVQVIEFGHKGSEWDSVYPSKKDLKALPTDDEVRLCQIKLKCSRFT